MHLLTWADGTTIHKEADSLHNSCGIIKTLVWYEIRRLGGHPHTPVTRTLRSNASQQSYEDEAYVFDEAPDLEDLEDLD